MSSATSRLRRIFTGAFTISDRSQPLPGDLRINWGVTLILMVLASSRGQRCSLQKLHFLAHLSRTSQTRREALEVLDRTREPSALSVRIEPWVNRALAFAVAQGHAVMKDGKAAALTDQGKAILDELSAMSVLAEERAFLARIGPRATEKVVDAIMKMEPF
ncbi:MAG: hypothetical protein Q8L59_15690 [Phenylobacterium sp.]|uniref:hypothetical protein n=1 Tax=Phenylobacterium sp. TaxID=1871053 RepID=UPI0027362041|nr:hypothetical protein [Phenylobacterium sp.]MDP1643616.1 hypothetical protein [Phenylobacterium sp.]MDP3115647.1 hypothetical protein [Phenylobacterium sp.]